MTPLARSVALGAWVLALGLMVGCATTVDRRMVGAVEVITLRHHYNNAHLVRSGAHAFLVDSGKPDDAQDLLAAIRDAGTDPASLRAVILTHGHADHAGGARALQALGVPVIAGAGDVAMLRAGHNEPLCPTGVIGRLRLDEDQNLPFEPTTADRVVDAPLALEPLTGIPGWIRPLPGHTEGSLVVTLDAGAVLVGDLLRGAIGGARAVRHFYICDLEDNRRDLEALLRAHAISARWVFPGHFGPLSRDAVEDLLLQFAGEAGR